MASPIPYPHVSIPFGSNEVSPASGSMDRLTSITGIGRSLQPDLRSHRIALAGAVLAAVSYAAVAVVTERELTDALIVGVVVFIAWAVGRELDPDRPGVAAWSIPIAFAASIHDLPSAVASAVALIGIRLVAGTIGAAVTWLDVAAFAVLGLAAGSTTGLWIVAVTMAIWLWTAPEVGRLKYAALGSLTAGAGVSLYVFESQDAVITQEAYVLAAVAGIVMMLAMHPGTVVSTMDARTGPIHGGRIDLARKAAGAFVMWAAVMGGVEGFWMVSPVLAGLMATAFAKWFSRGA